MDYKQELVKFFSTANGSERTVDLFFDLYNLICSFEPQIQHLAVEYVFTSGVTLNTNGRGRRKSNLYTESQLDYAIEAASEKFLPQFHTKITDCVAQNIPLETFYHTVWREIRVSPLLSSRLERAVAFSFFSSMDEALYRPRKPIDSITEDGIEIPKDTDTSDGYFDLSLSDCCKMLLNCMKACNGTERNEDVCFDMYMMITSLPESKQVEALNFLFKNLSALPDSDGPGRSANPMITDKQIETVRSAVLKHFYPGFCAMIAAEIEGNNIDFITCPYPTEAIWNYIQKSPVLQSDFERSVALCLYIFEGTSAEDETAEEKPVQSAVPTLDEVKDILRQKKEHPENFNEVLTADMPEVREYLKVLAEKMREQGKA